MVGLVRVRQVLNNDDCYKKICAANLLCEKSYVWILQIILGIKEIGLNLNNKPSNLGLRLIIIFNAEIILYFHPPQMNKMMPFQIIIIPHKFKSIWAPYLATLAPPKSATSSPIAQVP